MRLRASALAVVLCLTAAGCGTRDRSPEQKIRDFLAATEEQSREFTYTTTSKDVKTVVEGKIQDDLRNQATLQVDGVEVMERVVSDDALAVRIADPSKIPALANPSVGGSVIVGDALRQGRWVMDPSGAPPLVQPRPSDPRIASVGADPIQDSISIFTYAIRSIDEALTVREFNENDPNYRPDLDPFPHPNEQLGVTRFDLVRVPLPGRNTRSQVLPGVGSFRKMSFYVNDGKVFRILEKIDIKSHEDFERARTDKRKRYLLDMREAVLAGKSPTPIVLRDMSCQFRSIGEKVEVALPGDALNTSLKTLFGATPQPSPSPAQGSVPTSTATPAP